jgi:serine/threonine-protein kinase RsbW
MAEDDALDLLVPAELEGLEHARQRVLAYLRGRAGFSDSPRTVYAVELALEEWLTNVFRHGGCSQLALRVSIEPSGIRMHFEDDGPPFDPSECPQPALPVSLEEARPGGLGLFLIQAYGRSWRYARAEDCNLMDIWIQDPPG